MSTSHEDGRHSVFSDLL